MISKRLSLFATRDPIRIARWKRAINIAKQLFEDEGYHSAYLDDLLEYATKAISNDSDEAKRLKLQL